MQRLRCDCSQASLAVLFAVDLFAVNLFAVQFHARSNRGSTLYYTNSSNTDSVICLQKFVVLVLLSYLWLYSESMQGADA